MAKPGPFTDEMREFAVSRFAQFLTPQQVADAVNEHFGSSVDRREVERYNPEAAAGKNMAARWRNMHAEVRSRFLEQIEAIPIANRAARIAQLQIHYNAAVKKGNTGQALSILEQAAKEAGNVHTNERKVEHSGSIAVEADDLSGEQMIDRISNRLLEVWEKGGRSAGTRQPQTQH